MIYERLSNSLCVTVSSNVVRGEDQHGDLGGKPPSHRRSISDHLCIPLDVQMMKKGYL